MSECNFALVSYDETAGHGSALGVFMSCLVLHLQIDFFRPIDRQPRSHLGACCLWFDGHSSASYVSEFFLWEWRRLDVILGLVVGWFSPVA